jgi:hypothetical protein
MTVQFTYTTLRHPPTPAATVVLSTPDRTRSLAGVTAVLDTAADQTVIPTQLIAQLNPPSAGQIWAHGFGGQVFTISRYDVLLEIPGVVAVLLTVLSHSQEPYILVGRDVLNDLRVPFDGPAGVTEFH